KEHAAHHHLSDFLYLVNQLHWLTAFEGITFLASRSLLPRILPLILRGAILRRFGLPVFVSVRHRGPGKSSIRKALIEIKGENIVAVRRDADLGVRLARQRAEHAAEFLLAD